MKVVLPNRIIPSRGHESVEVGNVYFNPHGRNHFKVVIGKNKVKGKYNNIVIIKVNFDGEIIGAVNEPETYIKNHQDLVGRLKSIPVLDIELFTDKF